MRPEYALVLIIKCNSRFAHSDNFKPKYITQGCW